MATKTAEPEVTVPQQLTHTVSFKRTVQVRQYEPAEAGIFIQFDTARDASPEDIIGGARDAFMQAKGVVFEQLGISADLDDSGVVVELVQQAFPGSRVVSEQAAKPTTNPKRTAPDVSGKDVAVSEAPPFNRYTKDKSEQAENKEWAKQRLAVAPDEFWDNRGDKRNPNAPDFKHKTHGVGVWETEKE